MDYDKTYYSRENAKTHKTKSFEKKELDSIRTKMKDYFAKKHPETELNTFEANYMPLVNEINKIHGDRTVTARFICDLYNKNSDGTKKNIKKLEAINACLDNGLKENTKSSNPELKSFAKRIYIELKTRKAGIVIDEENDVIEEIYDSWYKLFNVIRDEIKDLPTECLNEIDNPDSPVGIAMNILNGVLRPHLTEHQAKFRYWLKKAKANPKNNKLSSQELQRWYPGYPVLTESLKKVNINLQEIVLLLERTSVFGRG